MLILARNRTSARSRSRWMTIPQLASAQRPFDKQLSYLRFCTETTELIARVFLLASWCMEYRFGEVELSTEFRTVCATVLSSGSEPNDKNDYK
jgi:hypothetical protein